MPVVKKNRARRTRLIQYRRLLIAELFEDEPQMTQYRIMEKLEGLYGIKVTQPTISNDLKIIKQLHWQRSNLAMSYVRQRLLEEYQKLYNEALQAWYKSCEDFEVVELTFEPSQRSTELVGEVTFETSQNVLEERRRFKRIEGRAGDVVFLDQALKVLEKIEQLFGLTSTTTINQQFNTQINAGDNSTKNLVILPSKDELNDDLGTNGNHSADS